MNPFHRDPELPVTEIAQYVPKHSGPGDSAYIPGRLPETVENPRASTYPGARPGKPVFGGAGLPEPVDEYFPNPI
jgi:hypothetical protein